MAMINLFKKKEPKPLQEAKEEKIAVPKKKTFLLQGSESVLLHPHVTEKASLLSKQGQYVFVVNPKSNKYQVKNAIEYFYAVHVKSVRIVRTPPKMGRDRKSGRMRITEKLEKKAIISLRKGEKLELLPS